MGSFRILKEGGKEYVFNTTSFRAQLTAYQSEMKTTRSGSGNRKISVASLRDNICAEIGVTPEAMKHWIQGHNGPGDIDLVRSLGKALDVDYHVLLKEKEAKGAKMANSTISKRELKAARKMYYALMDIIEDKLTRTYIRYSDGSFDESYSTEEAYEPSVVEVAQMVLRKKQFDLPADIVEEIQSFLLEFGSIDYTEDGLRGFCIPSLRGEYEEYIAKHNIPDNEGNLDRFHTLT